jgi:hypothetical protein
MNARELVDHIRSGPAMLVLDKPLPRFRRRTRSNPCDFNEFLQALQSSETIRTVRCDSHQRLSITKYEWVLLVKTLGRIRDIHNLWLCCRAGSRDFRPFQAVAEALDNAHSLCELEIGISGISFPRDPSGLLALANALREHKTLQEFTWLDSWSHLIGAEAVQGVTPDCVLRALPACRYLQRVTFMQKHASGDAITDLLQLESFTDLSLVLKTSHWLAVAEKIRQGICCVRKLRLMMCQVTRSEATEAVKAIASAIREDRTLEDLTLQMENGFTDEAGVALAEALTVNKTLHTINLSAMVFDSNEHTKAVLGASTYEAFTAMLRVNTSLVLGLPPFKDTGGDHKRDKKHFNQMVIELRLNKVGRGRLLASRQTTREEWVDALHKLSTYDDVNDSPSFDVSCLYSLLRLNPAICLLKLDGTTNPGDSKSR